MGLDFDVREFCQNLRATKPPYECPVKDCGKVYKSFAGIQFHLFNFNHENPGSLPQSQQPLEALTYAEAQRIVEVEVGGKTQRMGIFDSIPMISKEEFEILYPTAAEMVQPQTAETLKTPNTKSAVLKNIHKKTPKSVATPAPALDIIGRKEATVEKPPMLKLPEAMYSILENFELPDAPERPKSYYRFIEKTPEELEDEVEYDMDEEDFTWLDLINQRRKFEGLMEVSAEAFELLMDRLEKESYFLMQSSGKDQGPPIDEDAVCCICMDGECQNSNVILFCDMCNLAVHQECYGVPYIPEGQWLCRRCLQSPSRAVDCVLCPNRGGAFKQTDDGRWAHVVCALWIPEVCFANTVFLEPIDSIGNIPPARWKLTCYVCKQRGAGACIQCHKANCYTAFHVTCAQQAGLHMKIDTVKESSSASLNVSVRKTAYCDVHTPSDAENRPSIGDSYGEILRKAQSKAAFREKMRKARKILAEKRSAAPVISIPTIPPERIQEIASSIHISGRNQFVQRLIAYWTLKRHSRNGVPLLRRLQMSHASRRPDVQASVEEEQGEKSMDLFTQLRCMQRLRQDLERARLLCELVRKREKTKRELLRMREKEIELRVMPLYYIMDNLWRMLKEKDTSEIFAEPVDASEVPDYLTVIKHPMDLSTMQKKIDLQQYPTLDSLEKDFQLMISNCMTYNAEHTVYYKAAVKLRDAGALLFKQARKDLEVIAADSALAKPLATSSGSEATNPGEEQDDESSSEETPQKSIAEVVDTYLSDKNRDKEALEQQLSKLEELLHSVQKNLSHGPQRQKRVRLLRSELAKVRRKLSLQAGGRAAATRSSSPQKKTRNRDPKQYKEPETDENSSSGSSDGSDSSSSDSESDTKEQAAVSSSNSSSKALKTRARVSAAARQLKIDSFVTRTPAVSALKDAPAEADDKSSTKNRFVAKVMKRARAENSAANSATACLDHSPAPSTRSLENLSTPVKMTENSANQNLSGSPSGVNRRTAVLFTKKAAAAFKKPESLSPASSSPPRRNAGRPRKTSESNSTISSNVAAAPTNSTNLFSLAAGLSEPTNSKMTTRKRQKATENADSAVKNLFTSTAASSGLLGGTSNITPLGTLRAPPPLPNIESESFKVYRTSRKDDVDDDDFTRKSNTSSLSSSISSSESSSESGDESGSSSSSSDESSAGAEQPPLAQNKTQGSTPVVSSSEIPLQPLDLVWAKCRGFPWYPALIVDPSWPRTGYVHNGVPIPVPPDDVLAMKASCPEPSFLVLFFDAKRKWLWLPRNKLEPLGVDPECDKAKLMEGKKPAERKAVKKAYEEAILHQCRVSGQSGALSEDSTSEHSD